MANCQSCGMPIGSDPAGGGTNADGSKTTEYCGFCYRNGRFTEPDITREGMAAKVQAITWEKFWMPGFVSWFFVRNLPKLRRWRGGA